jgi:adenylyltransferase/sulfurtransferase
MVLRNGSSGHVVTVGAGNIGSHFIEHLGRMPGVSRVTLVDPGRYEEKNVIGQRIDRDDVGRAKVDVQAERLRRIDPDLPVAAIPERVEDVPLGRLRGEVIVAGLDNRRSRQVVNEAARRLGVPWIDAGVDAGGLLARINVYGAREDCTCFECGWDDRDYRGGDQVRPCDPEPEAPPTNAPASLGALAASLEAIECEKILSGDATTLTGRQVLIDARYHRHYVTSFRRNAECRLADHGPWEIGTVALDPAEPTLAEAVESLAAPNAREVTSLAVWGQRLVRGLTCPECAARLPLLRVAGGVRPAERVCPNCKEEMLASGFDTIDQLDLTVLSPSDGSMSLGDFGVREGDVLVLGGASGLIRTVEISLTDHSEPRRNA